MARDYEAHKEDMRERAAAKSRTGREIGPLPKCEDKRRRARGEKSLLKFCELYFPQRFPLPWSDDHLEQLEQIQRVIVSGGLQAIAAPRGDGKTTRLEIGILWGVIAAGAHSYAVLLSAVGKQSPKLMSSIKMELSNNDKLAADFPEVCYPIRCLDGIPQKCAGQFLNGKHTWPAGGDKPWARARIVLPHVAGSVSSGAVIESSGLLEATRGIKYTRHDGTVSRPSLALIDDPQTHRSAKSEPQCQDRLEAITSGILYLPGPGQSISALASVTVLRGGDMADQILRRDMHPEWHGIRKRFFDHWPAGCDPKKRPETEPEKETAKHWDEYAQLYRADCAAGGDGAPATKYYRKNRKEMDRSALPTWKHRKPGCLSATEYGMRMFYRDRKSMLAELQNDPEEDDVGGLLTILTADQIQQRVNGYAAGEIPVGCERLTWFVDVHKELLYYGVCAWEPGFTGYVVDYGTWPKQLGSYFDLRTCRQPISRAKEVTATTLEGKITQALDAVFVMISTRQWTRQDGLEMHVDLGMVDANWGELTDTVYDVCRQAQRKHGLRVMPSHGVAFGAAKKPISRWDRKQTRGMVGDEWHIPPPSRGRAIRHVLFDAGRRKSFLHRRLTTPPGDPGSLTLYHAPTGRHRLIAEHLTAESGVTTSGPFGDTVAWTLIPGRDNHWLDVLSGCCTAESILGGKLAATESAASTVSIPLQPQQPKKKRVSYISI